MPAYGGFELLRSALEALGVRYAVGGSWASTAFGEPRFTNDVDILADFTLESARAFVRSLPSEFYADEEDALRAIRFAKSFNVIHMPTTLKFDFFPASGFPIGAQELDRAVPIAATGLSETPVPYVTPEDILLAKLHWFRLGGEVSTVQWRDIEGLIRNRSGSLDRNYLAESAARLGVLDLLDKALPAT